MLQVLREGCRTYSVLEKCSLSLNVEVGGKEKRPNVSALDDWRHGWPSMRRVVRDESAPDRGLYSSVAT